MWMSIHKLRYVSSLVWFIGDNIVTITAQDGKTALHLAAEHGHITVVQVLIGTHADINLQEEVLCLKGPDL